MGAVGRDRGVSETAGVAVLVLLTLSVTAVVGLSVVFALDGGDPEATFDFDQIGDRVLITHDGGDTFDAEELVISGPDADVTWAENDEIEPDAAVGPGDATQIGPASAYGFGLDDDDFVQVIYDSGEDNRTILDERGERADPLDDL